MTASYPRLVESGLQSPQDIYHTSTTQHHAIGQGARLIGGRVFYYARHSAALTTAAGLLHVAATPLTAHEDLAVGTIPVGARSFTGVVATASVARADCYQYICVVDGGGEGLMYRISGHGTGTTITVDIYDEVAVALTAASQVSLLKDIYADVTVAVTDSADRAAGIAQVAMATSTAAAPTFVWLQTWGPCPAWVEGTPAEGTPLVNDDTVAGNLTTCDQIASLIVTTTVTSMGAAVTDTVDAGRVLAYQLGVDGTTAEVQMVDLCIRAA